jgi:hypothetical protein
MFPQPANKPVGPAEFLPILLSITNSSDTPSSSALSSDDVLPFLNDLANGLAAEQLLDTISPTLSLLIQEWFRITPAPDLMGDEWRRYVGAVGTLTQVKQIAAAVSLAAAIVLIRCQHFPYGHSLALPERTLSTNHFSARSSGSAYIQENL